jgi:PIN domain nuclease of toxin-antitoxin system
MGAVILSVSSASEHLEFKHNDPAYRFIAATAAHHGLVLATADTNLTGLPWLKTLR